MKQLKKHTALWTVLIFAVMVIGTEWLLRQPAIEERLPLPNISGYPALEEYLVLIDQHIETHGDLDCVLLGNSMVRNAVNPLIFAEGYAKQTGQPLMCFNLGIVGLTASSAWVVADILLDRYPIEVLIYATGLYDYNEQLNKLPAEDAFPQTALAMYHQGEATLQGWLWGNSALYTFYHTLPRLFEAHRTIQDSQNASVWGHIPRFSYVLSQSPSLHLLAPRLYPNLPKTPAFSLSAADYAGFQQMVEMRHRVDLLIVEMPTYLKEEDFAPNSPSGWGILSEQLAPYAHARGVAFWLTSQSDLISPTGVRDRVHLIGSEAPAFSDWLGQQVGAAVAQGVFAGDPSPALLADYPLNIHPSYQTYLGMDAATYRAYRERPFDLIPDDALVFNPRRGDLELDFLLISLGALLAWRWDDDLLDLMAVLEKMRYEKHLALNDTQSAALERWRRSKALDDLRMTGLDYLILDDHWATWLSEAENAQLAGYQKLASWYYPPLQLTYTLYHVRSAPHQIFPEE